LTAWPTILNLNRQVRESGVAVRHIAAAAKSMDFCKRSR